LKIVIFKKPLNAKNAMPFGKKIVKNFLKFIKSIGNSLRKNETSDPPTIFVEKTCPKFS
jgi:hypothetical protein